MPDPRAAGGERVPRLKRIRRQLLDGKPIDLYDANFLLRWLDELGAERMSEIPSSVARKTRAKYIAPIDEAELAVRMLEAGHGVPRPAGLAAREILARSDPEVVGMVRDMARAAMVYWQECIARANATN